MHKIRAPDIGNYYFQLRIALETSMRLPATSPESGIGAKLPVDLSHPTALPTEKLPKTRKRPKATLIPRRNLKDHKDWDRKLGRTLLLLLAVNINSRPASASNPPVPPFVARSTFSRGTLLRDPRPTPGRAGSLRFSVLTMQQG